MGFDLRPCVQVIAAEGEQKASRALREAADVIAESSSALQVQPVGLKGLYTEQLKCIPSGGLVNNCESL